MVSRIYATSAVSPYITPQQLYDSNQIPYFKLDITQQIHAADTVSFESPVYLPEASKISVVGDHEPFGGQIVKPKKTVEGYEYDCLDYTRLLFEKISLNKYNNRGSDIIKFILSNVGMATGNIATSTKTHKQLTWKDTKRIDIINQIATLEGYEFFINPDGIPIYRKTPEKTMGYVFYSTDAVVDFDISYDINDIITGVIVYGKDDKLFFKGQNNQMIMKYGHLTEILRDSDVTRTDSARYRAAKLFSEKGYPKLEMTITFPKILGLGPGRWIVFKAPDWVEQPLRAYYIESVKTSITEDSESQTLSLLEAQPTPPDDWTYKAQASTSSSSAGSGSTTISGEKITIPGLSNPKDVRKWVDANIKYQYYFDGKKTNKQVLSSKRANCVDQSELCIAICKGLGYDAKLSYGHTCGGVGHVNWLVNWNGRWRRGDTVCHAQSEF